jgi:predicted O-methyltransferase YrrM
LSFRRNPPALVSRIFYLDFLRAVHELFEPRTYLEIGVEYGHSLALSSCPSIGIDPNPMVDQALAQSTTLVSSPSEEYFARLAAEDGSPFGELPIDLAFIDGMHHLEYALADFVAIERHAEPSSVVVFDDIFPRNVDEAARDRHTTAWTGDVFRVPQVLAEWRPDLDIVAVATEPTGSLLVFGLDPGNDLLGRELDDIVREVVTADPQLVPPPVLARTGSLPPEDALALPIWRELKERRRAP